MRNNAAQQLSSRWTPAIANAASGNAAQRASLVAKLLAAPLNQDTVGRIALANNPAMLAAFDELDIAAADVGVTLAPPAVHGDFSVRWNHHYYEVESALLVDVLGLINRAVHHRLAEAAATQAQSKATARALELATNAELAYLNVVAAQQEAALRQQVFDAADAAVAVRQRMHDAGNTSDLALARELDQREQTRVELGRAQLAVEITREQLNAALGLTGDQTNWSAAGQLLPALPPAAPAVDELETEAVANNLGLAAARAQAEVAAEQTGIARKRQWLPELAVGIAIVEHGSGVEAGPAIQFGLPWFGSGRAMAERSTAQLHRAQHDLTALAINLRAAARAARISALATFAEANHLRDIVVPLRQKIVDETLLHYNAMNADPFTLIMAQRELTDGKRQLLAAQLRFAHAMVRVTALRRGLLRSELLAGSMAVEASMSSTTAPSGGH
jgi:cobalt-zinc-cadmium efflux system outer membrane protein